MHAVVAEVLAHRAARVGREELERRGIGGGGGDDDRVLERAVVLQRLDDARHGGALLPDADVDAIELLRLVAARVDALLVEEGVDRDGRLAGLAVADDQLALAAADGHERVDRLEAGLHRLVHRLAGDDARSLHLDAGVDDVDQRALAVDRVAEAVDHAAEKALAHLRAHDRAGALDRVAFLDVAVVAEDDDADIVGLEVEGHALQAVGEGHHLAGLDLVEAVDAGDAVADGDDLADLGHVGRAVELVDLLLEDGGNFGGADFHHAVPFIAS